MTMLTLAPSAVEAVDALLHSEELPEEAGLRIALAPGTDEIALNIEVAEAPGAEDEVIEEEGARVFVEPNAAEFLADAQLEARTQGDQIAFGVLPRPNTNGTEPGV
jgi:Fe-S cluster assembly iron-binding protein IscA